MNDASDLAGEWNRMRGIKPRVCVCRRSSGAVGNPVWNDAPWTEDFVDIEGDRRPKPRFRTRAKTLWDEQFFHVLADMVEPHLVATLTEKNSVIFHDNDFEIFIDPDGDNHNYYEFEVNAFNTIWELTLPKPYKDGGQAKHGTNLPGLHSAVSIRGTINDARDKDDGWSVEVAIPWKELASYNRGRATPPRVGDVWRVNFSRVEWKHDVVDGKYVRHAREKSPEDNWVWSPQGIIDMHRPERWGFVLFSDDALQATREQLGAIDAELVARDALMEVYHRQRGYRAKHGAWADTLAILGIDSTCTTMTPRESGFVAATTIAGDRRLHVREDSLVWEGEEPR